MKNKINYALSDFPESSCEEDDDLQSSTPNSQIKMQEDCDQINKK